MLIPETPTACCKGRWCNLNFSSSPHHMQRMGVLRLVIVRGFEAMTSSVQKH